MQLFLRYTILAALCGVVAQADPGKEILSRMDKAASSFSGMTANLKKLTHTAVIDDTTEESGTFRLRRTAKRDLEALIDFTKPDPKTVAFQGKKAEIFYPKMKTVQEYNLGKQSGMVEQFLMLGFGTSGKELASNYTIKVVGDETVSGMQAVHLMLTPKDEKVKEKLRQLDLWMSPDGTHPVQQKFLQPSGDYHLFTYLDPKLNPALSEDSIKLKLPKGTKREIVQK